MKYHTPKEFETRLLKIWKIISDDVKSQEKPCAYILVGQPGAGKSELIEKLKDNLSNAIMINGDDYRKSHKNYIDFQLKYGSEASKYTGEFAGKMTEALIQKAIDHKMNLIIEGTFRTSEPPLTSSSP